MVVTQNRQSVVVKVKALLEVLQKCRVFAATRDVIPVLRHFCFQDGRVVATDGVVGITAKASDGIFPVMTLPADGFTKLLATFSEKSDVRISVIEGIVEVCVAEYIARFHMYPVSDFPVVQGPTVRNNLIASESEALTRLRFAAADQARKPECAGVFFDGDGFGMVFDGIRLAWRKPVKKGLRTCFVPEYLLARMSGWEGMLTHYAHDVQGRVWLIGLEASGWAVVPSTAFPNVRGIITATYEACQHASGFVGESVLLSDIVRRLLLTAEDVNATIELELGKSSLVCRVPATAHYRNMAMEKLAVKTSGVGKETRVLRLNGHLLLDAVERFTEFFLIEQGLAAFAEERTYGHLIARLVS